MASVSLRKFTSQYKCIIFIKAKFICIIFYAQPQKFCFKNLCFLQFYQKLAFLQYENSARSLAKGHYHSLFNSLRAINYAKFFHFLRQLREKCQSLKFLSAMSGLGRGFTPTRVT